MPFGTRNEPGGTRTIDFDALYETCIAPAAEQAGVEVIRADEETLGGIIHKPMYERLLLAEIVVADLTFANPNVFYELGVRHAARPRSTILIYAKLGALPFDVAPIRAIPYDITPADALADPDGLRATLADRLERAKTDEAADSPLFQLLADYPGVRLAHESTEAFRARAIWVSELTVRAHEVVGRGHNRDAALAELADIESEIRSLPEPEEQLLVTLLLSYRAVEAWDEMIRVAEGMPGALAGVVTIREQLAMALNRRAEPGDRQRAIGLLTDVIEEHGASPETLGLLGRCFKDRWREKHDADDAGAGDALDDAIDAYARGFEVDPRDFYPGINLVTLLLRRGTDPDLARIDDLAPVGRSRPRGWERFGPATTGPSQRSWSWPSSAPTSVSPVARRAPCMTRSRTTGCSGRPRTTSASSTPP